MCNLLAMRENCHILTLTHYFSNYTVLLFCVSFFTVNDLFDHENTL